MKQKRFLWAPIAALTVVLLVNSLLFYFQNCAAEYLENTNYKGETQSISRQVLRIEQEIMESLPKDKVEAQNELRAIRYESDRAVRLNHPEAAQSGAWREGYENLYWLFDTGVKYDTMRMRMGDTINSLSTVSIFQRDGYDEALARTANDFFGISALDVSIVLDYGINLWVNDYRSDFFVVILAVCFGICFSLYRRKRLKEHMQAKGIVLLPGFLCLLLGIILLYGINFWIVNRYVYAYDLNTLVQSFTSFYNCPEPMRLWVFLLQMIVSKCVMGGWIYGLSVVLCHTKGRQRILESAAGLVVLFGELALYLNSAQEGILYGLREINIWSISQFERFVQTYRNLEIFGMSISRKNTFLVFAGVLSLLLIIWVRQRIRAYTGGMQEQLQYAYYEEINQKYMETRQLWHDFHNHLLAIEELMRRGRIEEANRYLFELEEEIDHTHILTKTGMEALDVLLYQKSELAGAEGIILDLQIQGRIESEEFSPVAVCCVVGNLLDNGIEAVRKLGNSDKRVSLEIQKKGDMLYISAENPYDGILKQDARGIATTKENTSMHGFGIKSVERICERFGGHLLIETKDGIFRAQALMMAK